MMASQSNATSAGTATDGDKVISFPPEVEAAIAEILPSEDPLDAPDFSTVDYINTRFPTEQSLTNLDDVITDMRCKVQDIDDDIRRIVRAQTRAGGDAAAALEEAQAAIAQLFTQIRDIKAKAGESEAMVRDITRDIKQLDTAKKNLTAAITTLNHLHMLVGGVATLQGLTVERQYGEAAMLLQGLMEVLEHFRNYSEIPQIKELSDKVHETRATLGKQITADFHAALSGEAAKSFTPTRQLAEACLVVDVLDPKIKKNLLHWVVNRELAEYGIIFADGEEEATWLDRVDGRYSWLKRHLIEFEERLGPMFPPGWEMSERIAVEFCDVTRRQLEKIMFRRKSEVDTKLLLHAISKTTNFESLLSRRFLGVTLEQVRQEKKEMAEEEISKNPFQEDMEQIDDPSNPFYEDKEEKAKEDKKVEKPRSQQSPFVGLISQCFEPYLSIYIESQDRNLSELVDRAAQEQKQRGTSGLAAEGSAVLHSCGDLFMFYKKCLIQCAQLSSSSEPLLALASVFKKHLREYATKVLIDNLPKGGGVGGSLAASAASMTSITKELKDFSTSGLIQNFQSLLKEADTVRLTNDEKVLVCTILVTAEYCLETTGQLEGKLREKAAAASAKEQISLSSEQDVYHGVINSCVQLLAQELESACEPHLSAMNRVPWASVEIVGDQSAYVTALASTLRRATPLVRDNLVNSKKYFTQFCVRFASAFIPKFVAAVYRCRPLGAAVAAEQLLLDTHSVKTLLLELPAAGSSGAAAKKPPASYARVVVKGMTRVEMTLKVVMSPATPVEQFVEQYMKLVPDAELSEFHKVLDMKGVRKVDQPPYVDYFKTSAASKQKQSGIPAAGGSSSATSLSPAHAAAAAGAVAAASYGEESRIKKLENLIKKRL